MKNYAWPGNIRELYSALLQSSFMAEDSIIKRSHIQLDAMENEKTLKNKQYTLEENEKIFIQHTLDQYHWNIKLAAEK
ncbi:hypothetical protein [Alteribacillus bidgolensis]|uniref:Nif-specific regulatory protein n=1 Tax=Alteribacillus bidgolensis TaxID=930129 RepID=A0A1G8FVR4_9BACI|nr:hypothetical protein [Alteribacillus bidgolensis]SDH86243.1 Nif-specific regulatory protein [Alteribacillus bidgolensis]